MKRLFSLLIAGLVFAAALLLLRPEALAHVVVTSRDLPAGHRIGSMDLEVRQIPASLVPQGAYTDPSVAIGETLSVGRAAGDAIYPSQMGGEQILLADDERAIAIEVNDSAGLAGLLKAGDQVGVTAVIFGPGSGQGAFAKTISGGFRVLYITPDFAALDPLSAVPPEDEDAAGSFSSSPASSREEQGTVVLAVPVQARSLAYDFAAFGVESEARLIHLTELLPALDHAQNVELSLYLEPDSPQSFTTSGLYLPDLVITPGPSPTPTATGLFELPEVVGTPTPGSLK